MLTHVLTLEDSFGAIWMLLGSDFRYLGLWLVISTKLPIPLKREGVDLLILTVDLVDGLIEMNWWIWVFFVLDSLG